MNCRACGSGSLKEILNFGNMPIANGFLSERNFDKEGWYPLRFGFCPLCKMAQLISPVHPNLLFNENYPFLTASSDWMVSHFANLVDEVMERIGQPNPFVIEIGSNDGSLLKAAKGKGAGKVLGFEPANKIGSLARKNGINTILAPFEYLQAQLMIQTEGPAHLIIATNTLCHVHDLNDVLRGVKAALARNGLFVFEDPYLPDILRYTTYDQIYDEHKWYFSVTSVVNMLERHHLALIDIEPQEVHGGSMRYYVTHADSPISKKAYQAYSQERFIDLGRMQEFAGEVTYEIKNLTQTLGEIARSGRTVAGYAATSKSTTILNSMGYDAARAISYITDTTPVKQEKFSPGVHIPIVPPDALLTNPVDYVLMFAWNHWNEIRKKDSIFREKRVLPLWHTTKIAEKYSS